ncbi:MAG: cobalamin-dependent protein, partial [Hyphomicrobiales bacterium]|nr:cobalamin-dependent protein [Hyphomicrobiales bacterium]
LGLTEQQPENNVYRILLEMLAVVLSKNARARAVQLPAWNEALGLPRSWDQQWSLRMQQIVAYETDLLEFEDIFDGSAVIEAKVSELTDQARSELKKIDAMGGAVAAVESSYMKQQLVESNAARLKAIEMGKQVLVGVNRWTETEPSPLNGGDDNGVLTVAEHVESEQISSVQSWRASRSTAAVTTALAELAEAAQRGRNIMEPSIRCAKAGVTTGEWGKTLRSVFGEYRAPTGVGKSRMKGVESLENVRAEVERVSKLLGRRIKLLVGKPGLDGHSNGAEQIAVRARDSGMEVIYEGIRLTPAEIVNAALEESAHVVGLSILSGSHIALVQDVLEKMRANGLEDVPVIVGGIIPPDDAARLRANGVAAIYTPKDFQLNDIMMEITCLLDPEKRAA